MVQVPTFLQVQARDGRSCYTCILNEPMKRKKLFNRCSQAAKSTLVFTNEFPAAVSQSFHACSPARAAAPAFAPANRLAHLLYNPVRR